MGHRAIWFFLGLTGASLAASPAFSQSPQPLRVIVNSNQDGPIQPDNQLTLREAISLVNGALPLDKLSELEKSQVSTAESNRIEFNLPTGQTTIRLLEELPPLATPGLTIDGTTQPGYQANQSTINELPMPTPVVALTPVEGKIIQRGLTVVDSGITIRGLSIYGFTGKIGETVSTPPADIFVAHRFPPPNIQKQQPPANFAPFYPDDTPPKDVVIEQNWLGMPPAVEGEGQPQRAPNEPRSAFGISVFNGVGTIIRRNWIQDHDGSAIITSVRGEGLQITENVIVGNGVAGMPDAIRLEGKVNQTQVVGNLICANDGSAVYLFKPEGTVQVQDNQITYNARRLRRAAVYLMGSGHQVVGNQIRYQVGPGVVVAAYPPSDRNRIQENQFSNLEGLSIDLVTYDGTTVYDYQRGDGPNAQRNSPNRRQDTGNAAINAPQFLTQEFIALAAAEPQPTDTPLLQPSPLKVAPMSVEGMADPGTQVDIYRVQADGSQFGPLSQPLATVKADAKGKFQATLENLQAGESISAIATDPRYGTSEPALNARIRSLNTEPVKSPQPKPPSSMPRCTTPVVQAAPEPPPTEPIRLQVPNVVHFALDQATISPATAQVLTQIAQVLRDNPTILVQIRGYTDPRGTVSYNQELGMRRAISVRNYLLRQGIAPERMTIRSFGEKDPVSPGRTRQDFARDRRVELVYTDASDIEVIIQESDLQVEPGGSK